MTDSLRFIVASPQAEIAASVADQLTGAGALVASRVSDPSGLEQAMRRAPDAALYIDLGEEPEKFLGLIEALPEPHPPLLVGSATENVEILRRTVQLGALGYFAGHELGADLGRALEKIRAASASRDVVLHAARMVAVLGSKGGVGTTTVASQLAVSLFERGERVAILDANLHLGDVALHFDLKPRFTVADIAARSDELDINFLRTLIQHDAHGVAVLAAPERLEQAEAVHPEHMLHAIELMRGDFDWIIVDLPALSESITLQSLDVADLILVVTTPELSALSKAKRYLDALAHAWSEETIHLVVNRHSKNSPYRQADLQNALGRKADVLLPNDYACVAAAVEQGKSVAEINAKAAITTGFETLSDQVFKWSGLSPIEARPTGGSFLSKWMSGRKGR